MLHSYHQDEQAAASDAGNADPEPLRSGQGDRRWHGASAPSPRLRGEGRGEGASPQAQTREDAPSPALSPLAGRGAVGPSGIRIARPSLTDRTIAAARGVLAGERHGLSAYLAFVGPA